MDQVIFWAGSSDFLKPPLSAWKHQDDQTVYLLSFFYSLFIILFIHIYSVEDVVV